MADNTQKKKVRKVGLYFLYGAITVCLLITIMSFGDIGDIFRELGRADLKYIFIAIALLIAYVALYPITTCILARSRKLDIGFGTTYVIGMTEHFFNGITPFATGGQPFQIYAFNKEKIKPSESTGLLLMNFIIFMIVTNGYAICSLFFYGRFVNGNLAMNILAIVGFTMNFGVLAFIISLATSKRLCNALIRLMKWLARRKLFQKLLESRIESVCGYFENVQAAFKALMKKKGTFFLCLVIKIVTMGLYYAITFYILRALHVDVSYRDMFFIISGTSFAITMVVFLPTPGSSGGIEFAFKQVFASIAGGAAVAVSYGGMLIWRLLSYYLTLLISLGFYIGFEVHIMRRNKKRAAIGIDERAEEDGELGENECDGELQAEVAADTQDSAETREEETSEEETTETDHSQGEDEEP